MNTGTEGLTGFPVTLEFQEMKKQTNLPRPLNTLIGYKSHFNPPDNKSKDSWSQ